MAAVKAGPQLSHLSCTDCAAVIEALQMVQGSKDITLDEPVMRHLDQLCGIRILKKHGVSKIFSLNNQVHNSGGDEQIHYYLIKPTMLNTKKIADQINADLSMGRKKTYTIFMIPRRLHVAEQILEHEGVYGNISIHEIPLKFMLLDNDIISLENPEMYRRFFLDKDQTYIHSVSASLSALQDHFGPFKNVFGQGQYSKLALDLMQEIYTGRDQGSCEFGYVFLFDRDVDYLSVLMSQMTFEGMLDETFGIKNGIVQFGSDVTGEAKPVKLKLNSEDKLFEEVRDRHMSSVFHILSSKIKNIQTSYDKRHEMSINEMKKFVSSDLKGLKQQHKSLGMFVGACEVIMKQKKKLGFDDHLLTEHSIVEGVNYKENISFIEEAINRQFSKLPVLRLMCLMSLSQDGLSSKDYKFLITQYCQSYGFDQMLTFLSLKKLGLFAESDSFQLTTVTKLADKVAAAVSYLPKKSNFRAIARKLNLVPKIDANYDLKNPSHMGYVFSGAYTPLIPRLVEHVIDRKNFTGIEDVIKMLPGPTIVKNNQSPGFSPPPVALVYFIGGVTRAEIAALRLIGAMKGWKIIVATTAFTTGSSLLESLIEL